ncbi:MAG TPA: sensor domain-containing diguanylate cyclase, partial [Polyangiaceae bacterium]
YRVLSDASFEGITITSDGMILDTNEQFASWLGYEAHELLGIPELELLAPEERARVLRLSKTPDVAYESVMTRRDGSTFPVEVRGRFVAFRGKSVRMATVRDITERKQREARLQAESLRDELTGLYNRRGFMELAQKELEAANRVRSSSALFFADLNGMKQINDQLGHEMGDHAIRAAASVLSEIFRPSDVITRLGGDEFAVFVSGCDEEIASAICSAIEHAVERVNKELRARYRLSISVGFAVSAQRQLDLSSLMQEADTDMYRVKRGRHARGSLRILPN